MATKTIQLEYMSRLVKEGYIRISEEKSPIIFNIFEPMYLKKKNTTRFAVCSSVGDLIIWDDAREHVFILDQYQTLDNKEGTLSMADLEVDVDEAL